MSSVADNISSIRKALLWMEGLVFACMNEDQMTQVNAQFNNIKTKLNEVAKENQEKDDKILRLREIIRQKDQVLCDCVGHVTDENLVEKLTESLQ